MKFISGLAGNANSLILAFKAIVNARLTNIIQIGCCEFKIH